MKWREIFGFGAATGAAMAGGTAMENNAYAGQEHKPTVEHHEAVSPVDAAFKDAVDQVKARLNEEGIFPDGTTSIDRVDPTKKDGMTASFKNKKIKGGFEAYTTHAGGMTEVHVAVDLGDGKSETRTYTLVEGKEISLVPGVLVGQYEAGKETKDADVARREQEAKDLLAKARGQVQEEGNKDVIAKN